MRRLRVLHILNGFAVDGPAGGMARFCIELSRAFDRDHFEIALCGLWHHGSATEDYWIQELNRQGVDAFAATAWDTASPLRSFRAAFTGIRQRMADQRMDIIHSHCQFGDIIALMLRQQLRPWAVVRTLHNEREWARRPLRRLFLTNILYPLAFQREIGVSQQVVDNLNRRPLARLLGRRAIRIYNSLNVERFIDMPRDSGSKRRGLGVPEGAFLIGSVGRLTEQKGYSVLLDAASRIIPREPRAWFVIVGDGPLRDDLQSQAERLGIAEKVIFTGSRADVEEILVALDVFVSSSLWEGLPTVIMESMAAGIPVVATDVSGTRELIRHNVSGYMVPSNDAEKLADMIMFACLNTNGDITQNAHAEITARFSIRVAATQCESLYVELKREFSKDNAKEVL